MIRIVLDQGLPRGTVSHLRREGWDVVHVAEIGMSRATDQEILDYARREKSRFRGSTLMTSASTERQNFPIFMPADFRNCFCTCIGVPHAGPDVAVTVFPNREEGN